MLNNPILPTLNQDDVNQRYAGSYIDYEGKILYVRTIVAGKKPIAAVCDGDGKEYNIDPFDWKLLDTRRPKAGWYSYKDKNGEDVVFYFQLSNRKQFHRGLTEDNCMVWYPYPDGQGYVNNYRNYRVAFDSKPIPKKRITSAELVELLSKDKYYAILQRYLCAARSRFMRGGIDIHYKTEMVAQWYKDEWSINNPNFVDEIKESVVDFTYKGIDEDKNLMEYNPNEDERANNRLKALKEKLAKPMPGGILRGGGGGGGGGDPRRPPPRMQIDWNAIRADVVGEGGGGGPVPAIDNFDQWWAAQNPADFVNNDADDEPGENPL